ncbi:MAG TPA: NlpC/P60 family protein [Balneolaceae bacterium]|nr:NlpC/P60 family protein [Balneolaceae bacterium]
MMTCYRSPVFILWSAALFILFGSGCGIASRTTTPVNSNNGNSGETRYPSAAAISASSNSVHSQLQLAHHEWRGTPHILGGTGINGVDCSSFTQIVFREYFGMDLPRNTRKQLAEGKGIRRNQIRPGDLIFFRTSRRDLHVGIAMNGGDFLHAASSTGVAVSNLEENYWAGKYLGARRVL